MSGETCKQNADDRYAEYVRKSIYHQNRKIVRMTGVDKQIFFILDLSELFTITSFYWHALKLHSSL